MYNTPPRVFPYKIPQATPTLAIIPTGTGLDPALIISSLHYCNGFLLAPTSTASTEFHTSSVIFFKNTNHIRLFTSAKILIAQE